MGDMIFIPADSAPGGPQGGWTFEYVNKNLEGYNYSLTYSGNNIQTKVFDLGGGQFITATYNYTGNNLTSIVFSGDTPLGLILTKSFFYTANKLTSVTYS